MDRRRTPQKQKYWRRGPVIIVVALVPAALLLGLSGFNLLDPLTPGVDAQSLRIGTVTRGNLTVEVSGNGVLLPRKIEWIAAQVEGHIASIHRRAGERVAAGDVLVELNNPALHNTLDEAASALEGGRAALVSYEVELDNQLLDQQARAVRARYAYQGALLKLEAETRLRESSDIIPVIDYKRTQLEVAQLREHLAIEEQRTAQQARNIATQLTARQAQVQQLARARERAQDRVDALTVTASMDGIVQQLDLEIGQRLQPGDQLARIAQQDQLYAQLKILARQATDITAGQSAIIDTRKGTVAGHVVRVDPAVRDGTILVDVELDETLPRAARPELTVEGQIVLDQLANVLLLERPSRRNASGLLTLYRQAPDQHFAEKTHVTTGRSSLHHIEILNGLTEGDRVVLSDTGQWDKHHRIRIH